MSGNGLEVADPEDRKIITLARAARARTAAAEGVAVRDSDGRTYSASTVALQSLQLSAVQVAIAMAISSGAAGLEAVAICAADELDGADRAVVAEFGGAGVVVWLVSADGHATGRIAL